MIDFKDLDTDPMDAGADNTQRMTNEDIRAKAHIANGGGAASFPCVKCNGQGSRTYGYVNIRTYECSSCNGTGKRKCDADTQRARSASYKKGLQTQQENWRAYCAEKRDLIQFLSGAAEWSSFAASMSQQLGEQRKLSEKQEAAVLSMMAKVAARREAKAAEREEAKPAVDISAINKLFDTATESKIKRPVFRADGLTISKAPMHGRNAGALYVKDGNDNYLGKLMGGKFHASYGAPADTGERLLAIAADPTGESIKYARKTGRCGCCGRELVDPVSILAGIGPICAEKWGLDMFREMGREEYAALKAEEGKA
ncbi:hypothetical protein [Synechococcus phage Ssp-JY38]|nr:hypothetical protein [Synechococcus phage Yong-L2-223]